MEERWSMKGYFEHIEDKTYIDKYPPTIIKLDDLRNAITVEFGSGTCNDAKFLIEQVGVDPQKLFLIEPDLYYFVDGMNKLEGCDKCPHFYICDECPDNSKHCKSIPNIRAINVLEWHLPVEFADFVYANNFLHCLGYQQMGDDLRLLHHLMIKYGLTREEAEKKVRRLTSKDKIKMVITQAYDILKPSGVFFGMTLSDHLDLNGWKWLRDKSKKSEKEEFAVRTIDELQRGALIGVSPRELEEWIEEVGFRKVYTEIKQAWKPIRDFYFRFEK